VIGASSSSTIAAYLVPRDERSDLLGTKLEQSVGCVCSWKRWRESKDTLLFHAEAIKTTPLANGHEKSGAACLLTAQLVGHQDTEKNIREEGQLTEQMDSSISEA
jgi:hypothetical protein